MSDMFLVEPVEAESLETPLHPTVRYLSRLPEYMMGHIVSATVGAEHSEKL